jgi:transcriptional regulator GlxA family with amidase domain
MQKGVTKFRKIVFLCPPKVHLLDINGPSHVFYEAKDMGAPIEIIFASINAKQDCISSAGLVFSKLLPINSISLSPDDLVFIPGSENMMEVINQNRQLLLWLRERNTELINLCSVCIGSFWLAEAGILDGKECTTHWKYFDEFEKRYPHVILKRDNLFINENNLYLSAGVSSGIDLSLHILEKLFGFDLALKVSKELVYFFRRAAGDPQISTYLKYRNHIDSRIHDVQDFIIKNIHTDFTIDDLAEIVHMSKRNFSRQFKKTTELTVGEYVELIRVERASSLLERKHKIDQVALECGLKSTNQLRTLLRKHQNLRQ